MDQSGCIKGRSTYSNIRSMLDIINHVNQEHKPGILAFIDCKKAFDMVNWNLLFKTLETLNLGPVLTNGIKTLY